MKYLFAGFFLFLCNTAHAQTDWEILCYEAASLGKPEWRPMLDYVAGLHSRSTHPAAPPFEYPWKELGPGYVYGPAFGHWDIVHEILDVLPTLPEHALHQLFNDIKNQETSGLLPGSIYMPGAPAAINGKPTWNKSTQGHPPLWVIAVDEYIKCTGDSKILRRFLPVLIRQIVWFENNRRAEGEGFFYNDILIKKWESGVDEGVRFDETGYGRWACIDATSHVFLLYSTASLWSDSIGLDSEFFNRRAFELYSFINDSLYDSSDGNFYDRWSITNPSLKRISFESMWPVVVGATTRERAHRWIDNYLMDSTKLFTQHPIATVGISDPKFTMRMWRGPAWNSMTYWAARGCMRYLKNNAAVKILERALDESAKQFKRTHTIWEFYHPFGGNPEDIQRKPHTRFNTPCCDYLGHNPLLAMARLYEEAMTKLKP